MKKYGEIFGKLPLFQGIDQADMEKVLSCLGGRVKAYKKHALIISEEEPAENLGVVLKGCIQVINEDVFGNRNILEQLYQGDLYGAAFACAGIAKSPVSVVAVEDSTVMQLNVNRVLTVCPAACPFHQKLIENMVHILARKNVALSEKIGHISKRSTREKLLSFLSEESKKAGKRHFAISFNRQELADYLCVDRSAMSAELGKLRREGVVDFRKSEFWLK